MTYDSASGMLHCESCGRNDKIEDMQSNESQSTSDSEYTQSHHDTLDHSLTKEYQCKNCGAVLYTDADTTATTCSFCGAGIILSDRLSGTMAPAKVIPFKISKEEATQAFKKWCRGGLLTPKGFMNADRIKNITGMYVPFFLYDVNGVGDLNAACTRVRSYTRGDYIYTETKHYNVYRKANLNYLKIPVDASKKMDDTLMDKLEPFHYDSLKDFQMPYLAGYIAEKYNYDDKQLYPRLRQRAEQYVHQYIRSSIQGYTTTTVTGERIQIQPTHTYYTLFPVWMVCYDYEQAEHTFLMNGQTGKIVGKPPISFGKVAAWFGGISGVSFLLIKLIALAMGGPIL